MKIKKSLNKELKYELLVLAALCFLTVFMTYPLVLQLDSIIWVDGDSIWYVWNFWWWNKSVFELRESPFHTDYIFYPQTVSLSQSEPSPLNSFLSIPLQHLFGLKSSLNLLFLFSFVLAGFGCYLLVYYLTKNRIAAFVSGIIFAFSPIHFQQLIAGQIATASIQWIPFFVLYLIKTFNEKNLRNTVFAAVFFGLAVYSSWYQAVFLVLFVLLFYVYNYFYEKNKLLNKKFVKRSALMIGILALIVLPLFIPFIPEIVDTMHFKTYLFTADHYLHSADLADFFFPFQFSTLFKGINYSFYKIFSISLGGHVFIGFTMLAIIAIAFFKLDRNKTRFWFIAALFFFVLSLGPVLQVFENINLLNPELNYLKGFIEPTYIKNYEKLPNNREILQQKGIIPLPYALLEEIPFTALVRSTYRFALILMLCLSVLVGLFCARLLKKKDKKFFDIGKRGLVVFCICILILLEYLVIPIPIQSSYAPPKFLVPTFFNEISKDKEEYALLELPRGSLLVNVLDGRYMYYQTIHGKKIVGGFADRLPEEQATHASKLPFIKLLLYPELINEENINESSEILKQLKIKYIVIHDKIYITSGNKYIDLNKLIMPEDVNKLEKILEKNFPKSEWKNYPDEHITVIKVY